MSQKYTCPQCGGTKLNVCVLAWATLEQEPDGNMQTTVYGDHEWDSTHTMACDACHYCGSASDFLPER